MDSTPQSGKQGLIMDKHQILAIYAMAENLREYNRGILSMLGKEELAAEHEMAWRDLMTVTEAIEAASPAHEGELLEFPEETPELFALGTRQDVARARWMSAWAEIQAIKDSVADEAQELLSLRSI